MISFSVPLFLLPFNFFGKKICKNRNFKNFFLTFSDALLCLFNELKVSPEKDIILMPNFYCPDTLKLINKHIKIEFYKINDDLSVNIDDYFEQIQKHHPRIILNYCFLGSFLSDENKVQLKNLCSPSTVIIDDCAHSIISDDNLDFINENHFYIDSCRKHSPFLGSHLVNAHFQYSSKSADRFNFYKLKFEMVHFIEKTLDLLIYILPLKKFELWSQQLFLMGDAISCSPRKPARGSLLNYYLYDCLDLVKIKQHKKDLITYYSFKLGQIETTVKTISKYLIQNATPEYYPLFILAEAFKAFNNHLEAHGIPSADLWEWEDLETEFKDKMNIYLYKSIVVFPLTWKVKKADIDTIFNVIQKFKN